MKLTRAALAVPGDIETRSGGFGYDRRILQGLRDLGIDVEHVPLGMSFPDPTASDAAAASARLRAIEADRPVLVDGLALGAMDPATLEPLRAPLVALVHHPLAAEPGLPPQRRAWLVRNERAALAHAAKVVVTSAYTAAQLVADYDVDARRIFVAAPGAEEPSGPPAPGDPPLILSVGILVPRKGHDVLLRALARLVDRPWQAVIVGAPLDADFAQALRRLRSELSLDARVTLAGRVDSTRLGRLYREASLFALATRYEGYGMVFDEAMAHGLPIVSCASGAVGETVPRDAGVLVPADDADAFAAALRTLLEDDPRRLAMAKCSAAAGAARPAWTETALQIRCALESALAGDRDE